MSKKRISETQCDSVSSNEVVDTEITSDIKEEGMDSSIRTMGEISCPSLSGQSMLVFQLGVKNESDLFVRLVSNTGGGLFSNDWISCELLEKFVVGKTELTSGSFKAFFPNKSVNTGGFVMAVLKYLGLIQVSELNSRWHEHVAGVNFEQVIGSMEQVEESKKMDGSKGKRKSKED